MLSKYFELFKKFIAIYISFIYIYINIKKKCKNSDIFIELIFYQIIFSITIFPI